MSSSFTKRISDFFAPTCDVSGKRYVVGRNRASDFLRLLKENGLSDAKYSALKSLSPASFEKLIQVRCDLSGMTFDLRQNHAAALSSNYRQCGNDDQKVMRAKLVSPGAYKKFELARCAKTGEAFFSRENCYDRYQGECLPLLRPRHPDCKLPSRELSPNGFKQIRKSSEEIRSRLENWVGTVRGDWIGRHRIVSTLGNVSTAHEHDSPDDVESDLKLKAAQIGGNAMINFEWTIHRNDYSERYIAGYGPKGNPYYKTRWHHEKWFTGKATSVLAQSLREQRRKSASVPYQQGRGGDHFASILGVAPDASAESIRSAFKQLSSKYRPKGEIRTKDDEEALNRFIAVNEAFNYFRVKNDF